MKKISLIILVLVSVSNVFAMEESSKTDCKNMVQSSTDEVAQVATPVVREAAPAKGQGL